METPAPYDILNPSKASQEFLDMVDQEEFKRKMILQVMGATSGKNPLDYYLAELAVTTWMRHIEKSPEEFERMLNEIPLLPVQETDEGLVTVIDKADEPMLFPDVPLDDKVQDESSIPTPPEEAEGIPSDPPS
jgi:hypothetical protein